MAMDCIVVLDGQNGLHRAYMMEEEFQRINEAGGLSCADRVMLRETEDRPLPDSLKNGLAEIMDVWVTMVPGKEYRP